MPSSVFVRSTFFGEDVRKIDPRIKNFKIKNVSTVKASNLENVFITKASNQSSYISEYRQHNINENVEKVTFQLS